MSYQAAAASAARCVGKRYGTDAVVNGSGISLAGWSNGNSFWVVRDGRFYHASSGAYNELSQAIPPLAGNFLLEFDVELLTASGTAGVFYINGAGDVRSSGGGSAPAFVAGRNTVRFLGTDGVSRIGFYRLSTAEFYVSSVRCRAR